MTTFVLGTLASEKQDLQKLQCMLCETVFFKENLKPSQLQVHFDNWKGLQESTARKKLD